MNGRIVLVLLLAGFLLLSSGTLCAQERWIYRYNGPADTTDRAYSIAVAPDGNLCVAGYSYGGGTGYDFTVVSLTSSGNERWVYRYNGPGNGWDQAHSVVAGSDGDFYIAGRSEGIGTLADFTVVSLTDSGAERWIYRYNGPVDLFDDAISVAAGSDSNIYVAGRSEGSGTSSDFIVLSLTNSGAERWVCRYDGPGNSDDCANYVAVGSDGNVYAAGASRGTGTGDDFTIASITASGMVRWVYRYNGPGNGSDWAYSIAMNSGGSICAGGQSEGNGTSFDLAVVSLMDSGVERWAHRYNGPGNSDDGANSVVLSSDGNLYAAGWSLGIGTEHDFMVVCVTDSGGERWAYRYNGPGNASDAANAIVLGSDGNIYAAGYSTGAGTSGDFTVVSLGITTGIEKGLTPPNSLDLLLQQNEPNPFHRSTTIQYTLPAAARVILNIHDINGRLVETLVDGRQDPGVHNVRWDMGHNPSGVYFCRLTAGNLVETKKMVRVGW